MTGRKALDQSAHAQIIFYVLQRLEYKAAAFERLVVQHFAACDRERKRTLISSPSFHLTQRLLAGGCLFATGGRGNNADMTTEQPS